MIQAIPQVHGVGQKSKEDEEEMRERCRGVEGNDKDGTTQFNIPEIGYPYPC